MSDEIEIDVLSAEEIGKKQKEAFIEDRLMKNENFFNPVKKLKLKTMAHKNKKVKIAAGKNKVIEVKQHSNIAFQLLVKSQSLGKSLDLFEVMKFQLTPVPPWLGTADGFLNKTNKATEFNF